MIISPLSYHVFIFSLAYVLSVLYFPFEVGGTSIVSRFAPLVLLSIIAVNNVDSRLRISKYTIMLLMCFLLGGVSSVSSLTSLLFYLNFVLLSLVTYFASVYLFENYGDEFLYRLLRFIVIFSSVISVLGVIEYYFYDITLQFWFFRGSPYYFSKGQVSSLYSNPNIFGIITAISLQLVFMVYKAGYLGKALSVTCMLILIVGVFYSGARMAQAIAIIVFLYHIFYRWYRSPFLMVFVSYSALIMLSLNFDLLLTAIDLNFRNVVWETSKDIFYENTFFGVGMGNLQEIMTTYNKDIDWVQGPNNYVWGFLTECGLIFFAMFSIVILKVFWGKDRNNYCYSDTAILISIMLISQFSEHFLLYVSPFVMIFFLMLSIMSKPGCSHRGVHGSVKGS